MTAAGKLRAVGTEADTTDVFRVPTHRARGIGPLQKTIFTKGAGTIRVVFAAKLFEKFISIHLVSLVYLDYLVSKLLPVPVPGQRRLARASRRLPYLYGFVPASSRTLACHLD